MRIVFVGRHRAVWKRLALYLATLGVSRRIWLYRVGREVDGHEVLGTDHATRAFLLWLPVGGPSYVAWRLACDTRRMLQPSGVPFGPAGAVYLATWVPVLGNLFYIAWVQSRLNAFWTYEQDHPEHGVEVDLDLSDDPVFRAEIGKALKQSYSAGSRFEQRTQQRAEVRAQRAAARAAGASTPLRWWLPPAPPERRLLHITCGRCGQRFDVERDPLVETPVVCPGCGATEVLPSVRGDLQATQRVAVPEVKVDCPCGQKFHAVRSLVGPTTLSCPHCGRTDVLDPPKAQAGRASAKA